MSKIKSNKDTASSLSKSIISAAGNCGISTIIYFDEETTVIGNNNAKKSIEDFEELLRNSANGINQAGRLIQNIADEFETVDNAISKKISE